MALYRLQRDQRGLRDAAAVVAPYQTHPDADVRQSAQLLISAYNLLDQESATIQREIKERLDGNTMTATGSDAELLAKLSMQRHTAARGLIAGAGAAASALVVMDPSSKQAKYLRMTTRERDELLRDLRSSFGTALHPRDGQFVSAYARAAAHMQTFLTTKGWLFLTEGQQRVASLRQQQVWQKQRAQAAAKIDALERDIYGPKPGEGRDFSKELYGSGGPQDRAAMEQRLQELEAFESQQAQEAAAAVARLRQRHAP